MTFKKTLSIAALLLITQTAFAAPTGYAGIQYADMTYSEIGFSDAEPSALILRGGVKFNPYIAVELRYGSGLSAGNMDILGFNAEFNVDTLTGIYAVGILPVSDKFKLYGLIGTATVEATVSIAALNLSLTDTQSSTSFGIGGNYLVTDILSINMELTTYLTDVEYSLSAISIGFTGAF